MLDELISQMKRREDLSDEQIAEAIEQLISANVAAEIKANFLITLSKKGESVEEITAFAKALRDKSLVPPISSECRKREIIDVCGTGGDHQNTFNISTAVAILVASSGISVAKHGNRSITSKSGSADVLEALGIRIDLSPKEAAECLEKDHFAFFFAPKYHPAFQHIRQARMLCSEKKQRTLFNYLGPLLNPAKPSAQLLGVPDSALCEPIAKVLQCIGIRRGMVVSGKTDQGQMDELSTIGENHIAEFYQERGFLSQSLDPSKFPISSAQLEDLKGGTAKENAAIISAIFNGKKGPKRDAVILNSSAAFFLAGQCSSLIEGWEFATEIIDEGIAAKKLDSLISI